MDDPLGQPGSQGVVLAPRYGVPIGVVVLGLGGLALLPLWGGALWLAGFVVVFGLFLLLQAALRNGQQLQAGLRTLIPVT